MCHFRAEGLNRLVVGSVCVSDILKQWHVTIGQYPLDNFYKSGDAIVLGVAEMTSRMRQTCRAWYWIWWVWLVPPHGAKTQPRELEHSVGEISSDDLLAQCSALLKSWSISYSLNLATVRLLMPGCNSYKYASFAQRIRQTMTQGNGNYQVGSSWNSAACMHAGTPWGQAVQECSNTNSISYKVPTNRAS